MEKKFSLRFIKTESRKASYWEIFCGQEMLFTATVDDIFGQEGKEIPDHTWHWVSSKTYGDYVVQRILSDGIDMVRLILTGRATNLFAKYLHLRYPSAVRFLWKT